MRFGRHPAILGASGYSFIRALQPAAWYDASLGVTVTGQGVSTLADQSGNGRDLLQGTDASRPPYLSYGGEKYCWSLGVASNTVTAPTETLTGSQTFTYDMALDDYTPSADVTLFSKLSGNDGIALLLLTTGVLRLRIGDGAAVTSVDSTVAVGTTDATRHTFVAVWTDGVGGSFTVDGVALGTSVAAVKTLTNAATTATIGPWSGKLYRARIGTNYDFYPDRDGSDAATSVVSSGTSETWTVNQSGGLPAQIVGRASILFDGSADYLKTAAFTLNQPETVLLAFKQVSWTSLDRIHDGDTGGSMTLRQVTGTPQLGITAGTSLGTISPAVGSYAVVCSVYNGASSVLQLNLGTPVTGNAGASAGGGFTLGCEGGGTTVLAANLQFLEGIIFPTALSTDQITRAVKYLGGRHGIAL